MIIISKVSIILSTGSITEEISFSLSSCTAEVINNSILVHPRFFDLLSHLPTFAMYRCTAGRQDLTAERTLVNALRSCEEELKQFAHPPLLQTPLLIVEPKSTLSRAWSQKLYISKSLDVPIPRYASIALGEKFILDQASTSTIQTPAKTNKVYKKGDGLNMVMRATRETTGFISSVLVWALSDTSSHQVPWQQNLDVFRGEETLWSPAFRRLQERLRMEILELMRDGITSKRRNLFAFEELKLVEGCTLDLKAEIELLAERMRYGENEDGHSAVSMIEETVHQLQENLGHLQVLRQTPMQYKNGIAQLQNYNA